MLWWKRGREKPGGGGACTWLRMTTDVPSEIEASDDAGDQEYRARTTTHLLSQSQNCNYLQNAVHHIRVLPMGA